MLRAYWNSPTPEGRGNLLTELEAGRTLTFQLLVCVCVCVGRFFRRLLEDDLSSKTCPPLYLNPERRWTNERNANGCHVAPPLRTGRKTKQFHHR
uniref:Uncharacterized protein n=1 Tax=Daphnia magna TaxID=35525 RepID=A0A0P4ZGY4_9CRUS